MYIINRDSIIQYFMTLQQEANKVGDKLSHCFIPEVRRNLLDDEPFCSTESTISVYMSFTDL